MIDRTTKATLIAIAAALWLHLIAPLWESTPVHAQLGGDTERYLRSIESNVTEIEDAVYNIYRGRCRNNKIC